MKIDDIKNTQFFTVLLTEKCNYRCRYCDEFKYATRDSLTLENYMHLLRYIDQDVRKPISNIHLFGGEPTLNKNIHQMVFETKKRPNIYLNMTTNLSKSVAYFKDLDIILVGSYHHEYIKESPEEWFSRAIELHSSGLLKHVTVMIYPQIADDIHTIYHTFLGRVPMIIVPLYEYKNSSWFEEEMKKYDTDPFSYEVEQNHFIGEYDKKKLVLCTSGLIVAEDGTLHYCWPRYNDTIGHISNPPPYAHCHVCTNRTAACDQEIVMSHDINSLKFDPGHTRWDEHWIFCNA